MSLTTLVNRFDHIEVACSDIEKMTSLFKKLGFRIHQIRERPHLKQKVMIQGKTRFLFSEGAKGTFAHDYVTKHGEGVCSIAYSTEDAVTTWKTALSRGAEAAMDPFIEKTEEINVIMASIKSFGDVRATFVERQSQKYERFDVLAPFGEGFQIVDQAAEGEAVGLLSIDHLTNNVEAGKMDFWADFYKKIYGWVEARYFDIKGAKTGLHSKVLQSADGGCRIPVNEPAEAKSQIQEFLDEHKGPGVQHIALTTNDILKSVAELRKRGFRFLDVPQTYFESVPQRVPGVKEPLDKISDLNILVDGDEKGYLLQIFTENQIGPLFFEIIQRRGHNGFGEGNFQALFEAIERDQEKRGKI